MATSVSIPPFSPDPDPVECASRWAIWLQSLEFYFAAAEITTDARKKALLLHYVGPTAQEVFVKTLQPQLVTKNLAESYANIIAAFKSHFQPTVNTEFEIFRFRQARQREDETMDQYAARLRALAAHCSFADIDGELKSHIICSCLDPGLRRRALRDRGLDLQQLLSLARTYEATEQQAKEIETGLKDISITGHANAVDSSSSCPNCGTRHPTMDSCPARGYRCNHCQKVNHFAIVCRSRLAGRPPVSPREYDEKMAASHKHSHRHHRSRGHGAPGKQHARGTDKPRGERSHQPSRYHDRSRKPTSRHDYSRPKRERSSSRSRSSSSRRDRAHHISRDRLPRSPSPESSSSSSSYTESDGPEESFHVQALHLTHRLPRATVFLDNRPLTMTVDTGSSINVLRESDYQQLTRLPTLHRTNIRLFSFGSTDPLPMLGKFRSSVSVVDDDSRQIDAQFYVVAGDSYTTSLLSFNTAVDIGLVTMHASVHNVAPSTSSNRERHRTDVISRYPTLFQGIGKLKDQQVRLHIDPSVPPVAQSHRRLPFHLRAKVEQELRDLEDADIIERVNGPTPWISPIVVTPKPNRPDKIRLCVDMRVPNKAITRTRICTPTVDDVIHRLNGAVVFSKLDLNKGYHQLELHPQSREITAFATPMGTFRYKRLSFGITSAAEIFQETIRQLLCDIDGALNMSDDILIYGRTQEDHDRALHAVLIRLRDNNLTVNKDKCEFSADTLEFFGHVFSKAGISPDPKKVAAIVEMTAPTNASEVRSLLGMTNFCARFIPHYSTITEPLRQLIKQGAVWSWTDEHDYALQRLRSILTSHPVVAYFDPNKHTTVVVDASPSGLGAILTQRTDPDIAPQVVAYASRSLSDVERRYSQTEREALAVVWSCEHFHLYLYGMPFVLVSDHKPLEIIFNNPKSQPPARIQRWSLRLQPYDFVVEYKSGKDNPADYLSRHSRPSVDVSLPAQSAEEYVHFVAHSAVPKAMSIDDIRAAASNDSIYQIVLKAIHDNQWPLHRDDELSAYYRIRNELTVTDDDVILRGRRIIIPSSLRDHVINLAHEGHQGIVKTKQLLRTKVWFPLIDSLVEKKIRTCLACQAVTDDHAREPLKMTPLPNRPWEQVAIDFCGPLPSGHYLLVTVDEYSRFPVVEIVSSTSAKATISALHKTFAIFGIPTTVKSDNGPPFQSHDFAIFAQQLGFVHRHVTPYWPEANGTVERFMRNINKLIKTAKIDNANWMTELHNFLRNYRNTPHSTTGETPASVLFNYSPRSKLPDFVHPVDDSTLRARDETRKFSMKAYADHKRHTRHRDITVGDRVIVKQPTHHRSKTKSLYDPHFLTVIARHGDTVTARYEDGKTIKRNISQLKPVDDATPQRRDYPKNIDLEYDDHIVTPPRHARTPSPVRRYPRRDRQPPVRYGVPVSI